jgi:iron complex outermembrane receptor protein
MRFRIHPVAAAALAIISTHGVAQTAPTSAADVTPSQELQKVVVTGSKTTTYAPPAAATAAKSDIPLIETPMAVQVVPRELLIDQRALTLKDAVKNVSGVVQAAYDYYDFVQIRGFDNASANYRNGLRVPNATAADLAAVERVEVVKGPASMLYGRIEPGGLVNRVMKQPLALAAVNGQLQLGQFDLKRATLDATGKLDADGQWLGRAVGAVTRQGSFQDHVKRATEAAYGALSWRPSAQFEMNLNLDLQDHRFVDTEDIGVPIIGNRPANVPRNSFYGDPVAWELPNDHRRRLLGLDWAWQINEQWKLTQRLHIDRRKEQQFTVWFAGFDGVSTLERGLWFVQNERRGEAMNLDLTGDLQIGGLRHRVLLGIDSYRFWTDWRGFSDVTAELPPIDIFAPTYGARADVLRALPENFTYSSRERWTGLYAQDQISLSERWQVLVGGRFDKATDQGETDRAFSPRAAVLYMLSPQNSVYASYAKSFGSNNGRTATGERIDPQQARQFELGAKHVSADGRLSATAALFHLTKTNEQTDDPSTPDPFDVIAIGEVRSQGLELDVQGQVTRHVNLIATYTLTDAKITRHNDGTQGNWLANVPRHAGSLWAKFDSAPGATTGWEAGAGLFARGQRQGDRANSWQLPGYATVDTMLRWRTTVGAQKVSAQLNVENLFDRTYFDRGQGSTGAKYGKPRAASVTVSMDL